MNTANLQLEGVYAVLAALLGAIRDKKLFSDEEINRLLENVEIGLASDCARPAELRGANIDAICFPARFLRQALQDSADGREYSFARVASRVGQTKPDRIA
jgi:uncharacterized protein HemY